MRVLKFGGKSLETEEKFKKLCEFIRNIYKKEKQLVVVVSAIGDTTNSLINLSKGFGNNTASNRELAILLSTGETQASALFAMHLNSIGVPAKSYSGADIELKTFGGYNTGRVCYLNKSKLSECLDQRVVAVVAGFQGINGDGEITTLGRGGSDTTAVAIATVFNVQAEIYSDYDGIFAGDPRSGNYRKLKSVNYDTMVTMARAGSKVLDLRATVLAKKFNTPIVCKASSEPSKDGTSVNNLESDITSICSSESLRKITVVFSNESNRNKIIKTVNNILNDYNFYNFTINKNDVEFLVDERNYILILHLLSDKLNLLEKN